MSCASTRPVRIRCLVRPTWWWRRSIRCSSGSPRPSRRPPSKSTSGQASLKSDLDRTDLAKEKTGVFTGAHAINPVNGKPIPIWVADYVLISYGTGAIMAVPAHDERDLEFAQTFDLPVIEVVQPPGDEKAIGFTGEGTAINSGEFDGLPTAEFKQKIAAWLAEQGLGCEAVNYRLRDWLFLPPAVLG